MLVLSRKLREQIQIGDNVTITILRVKGNSVRIGIEAPRNVKVVRGELPREADSEYVVNADGAVSTESAGTSATAVKSVGSGDSRSGAELQRPASGSRGSVARELKTTSLPADQARMSVFVSHPTDQRVIEISNDGAVQINENQIDEGRVNQGCDSQDDVSGNGVSRDSAAQGDGIQESVGEASSGGSNGRRGLKDSSTGLGLHQRVLEAGRRHAASNDENELAAGQNRLRQMAQSISKLS